MSFFCMGAEQLTFPWHLGRYENFIYKSYIIVHLGKHEGKWGLPHIMKMFRPLCYSGFCFLQIFLTSGMYKIHSTGRCLKLLMILGFVCVICLWIIAMLPLISFQG